jgi:hypothetical protein
LLKLFTGRFPDVQLIYKKVGRSLGLLSDDRLLLTF